MSERSAIAWGLAVLGTPVALLAWAALLGVGMARQADPATVALTATVLVVGPAAALAIRDGRAPTAGSGGLLLGWSLLLLLAFPVYFPGERREAVTTGLALLTGDTEGVGVARSVADALPDEPEVAVAQVPPAEPVQAAPLPPPPPLDDHEIALPFEGEGRRLSVPVVFEQDGRTVETFMMLDTGATYTTLPRSLLVALGAEPGPDAPRLTLHTANGPREAEVVLLDSVWLGDLPLHGVAVTTCEDCANDENAGLLGLNVTGGYNMTIDADRREVVFSRRAAFNRRLDVRPFSELRGAFRRFPGGRVEAELVLDNLADRAIAEARATVACGEASWTMALGTVPPGESLTERRRLPVHDRCDSYRIELAEAGW